MSRKSLLQTYYWNKQKSFHQQGAKDRDDEVIFAIGRSAHSLIDRDSLFMLIIPN
jgi:hypothetical protein